MKHGSLWKISVSIAPEAEEAVQELLGTLVGEPACIHTDVETGTTRATVYVRDHSGWSPAKRALIKAGLNRIQSAGLHIGPARISARHIRREDWAESWKRHFRPIEIGPSLLIKPGWSRRRRKRNQVVVRLDPGLSFGTGQHATTRFCLEQLAAGRRPGAAQSFLDLGCGSGILSIAAAKLGYGPVEGIDVDPEAVRIARRNAKRNRVSNKVDLMGGNLATLPLASRRKFDLVCANLIFDLLVAERARILSRLKPDGTLVLAGILRTQFAALCRAYQSAGLELTARRAEKEWESGAFRWRLPHLDKNCCVVSRSRQKNLQKKC